MVTMTLTELTDVDAVWAVRVGNRSGEVLHSADGLRWTGTLTRADITTHVVPRLPTRR